MAPILSFSVLATLALSLFSSTVTGAEETPGVIGLPFTKREITSKNDPAYKFKFRKRQSQTNQVPIYNAQDNLLYLVNTTVGTPGQPVTLQLDTGSTDIWVPWAESSICAEDNRCVNGDYDGNASSTMSLILARQFYIAYVDGTKIGGDYVNDTLSIGGVDIIDTVLGVAKQAVEPQADYDTPFQGIMGVGFDIGESLYSQSNGQVVYAGLLSKMLKQGKVKTRAFSLWLNDLESSEGNILFGGVDKAKYDGELTILPLQNDTQSGAVDSFTVVLASLEITGRAGASQYKDATTFPVILDSGTTLTYLPDEMAAAIAQGVGATDNDNYGTVIPCDLANTDGIFKFQFGNANGPIIAAEISQFVLPFPADVPTPKFRNGQTACRWGILPAAGNPNLFGDTFLRSAYVVYNLEGAEVGIAPAKFNVTDSDIQQITETFSLPGATATAFGEALQTQTANNPGITRLHNPTGSADSANTGSATFDFGPATNSAGVAAAPSSSHSQGAAAGLTAPSTPFVGAIMAGATVLLALLGGSMLILL